MANAGSNNISLLSGTGSGSFDPAMNYSVGSSPRSVAVADFNHDGKPDLVANDDDAEWTIIVRPQTTGVYTNTATVTANEVDPNLSNNTDGSQTAVVTGISSVQLIPTCVKGGNIVNGTVTLSAPAPSGGAVVALSSSNTSVARPTLNGNFVNSITIPAGNTMGTFTVKTFSVYSTKTVKIKATLNRTSKEATLTVVQYRCS